jgi:membrane-bound inhibitor of C-type lysozyme
MADDDRPGYARTGAIPGEPAMSRLCAVLVTLPLLVALPALAAPATIPAAAPAAQAAAPAEQPAPAPEPAAPAATATSSLLITLNTTGDFERKTVNYGCQGDFEQLAVDYINAAPNYLAMIPLDGSTLLFNTVLAGSGAKYVAGKYVWWNKGNDASLYDLTMGANAKPIATCSQVDDTP